MVSNDVFDQFDEFSKKTQKFNYKQSKFKNTCVFIEDCINNFYEQYKKNKNSSITFTEYRKLMLKKLSNHYHGINNSDNILENDSTCSSI